MNEDMRFPIGEFDADAEVNEDDINEFIKAIENLPGEIRNAVAGLNDEQLDTEYRPDGWTIRQVVHHVGDSHMNAIIRFKLALTEDFPTIRPYFENHWADLSDSKIPLDASLKIIDGVHERWVILLKSMSEKELKRELKHPESGDWNLYKMLAQYAWHSKHHTAHITKLRERNDW